MKLEVNSLSDLQDTIDKQARVLVVFTQPVTCVPCRQLKPHLEKFAEKHADPLIVTVDLDMVPEAIVEYDLSTVPTRHLYENGRFVRNVEAKTIVQLENELN